jgi:hypothetical protein
MRTYKSLLYGLLYTYRGCTRGEIREALSVSEGNELIAEDFLVGKCILSIKDFEGNEVDPDWDNTFAGVVTSLAISIREVSGLSDRSRDALRQEAEEWFNTPAGESEALMYTIFGWTPQDVDSMDPFDWFRGSYAAEKIYQMQSGGKQIQQPQPQVNLPRATPPTMDKITDWKPGEKRLVSESNPMMFTSK